MRRGTTLLVAVLAVAIAGTNLAAGQAARDTAKILAAWTEQVRSEGSDILRYRTMIAKARQRNINALEESTVRTQQANTLTLELWKTSKDKGPWELLEIIDGINDVLAEQDAALASLRAEHAAKLAAAGSQLELRQDKLKEVSNILGQLSKKPKMRQEISFYIEFFKQVKDGVDEETQSIQATATDATTAIESLSEDR